MTVFQKIKSMDIHEFTEWYNAIWLGEDDPVTKWWTEVYCSKCKPIPGRFVDTQRKVEMAYCELYGTCKFFQDINHYPSTKEIIKMWLESEG